MCTHLYETDEDFQSSRYECETSVSQYFILSPVVLKDIQSRSLTVHKVFSASLQYFYTMMWILNNPCDPLVEKH
jgi:hypothetical protein